MAQFRIGRASVTQGEQIVSFTDADLSGQVGTIVAGHLFSFQGENVWYQIASLAVVNEKMIQLTLSTPYAGATRSEQPFAIHRDFTPNLGMPSAEYGDINTAGLYAQSLSTLDSALAMLGAVTGPLSGTLLPTFTLRQRVTTALAEPAGLKIHREGLAPITLLFTGGESWKRWSFADQDIETSGKIAIGRQPVSSERLAVAGDATIDGDLTVEGDLFVRGETLILEVENLEVEDALITVARNNSAAAAPYLGFKGERGGDDAFFVFDEALDRFAAYLSGNDLSSKALASIQAAIFYGALAGNAATASQLETARTLSISSDATGSVSFDGSSNADIALTLVSTGVGPGTYTKVTVDAKGRVVAATALNSLDVTTALGFTPFAPSDASSTNQTGKLVKRDASGGFEAGAIVSTGVTAPVFTGDLAGTATAAGKWATARTLTIAQDASGAVSFDGSNNATLQLTLANTGVTAAAYSNLTIDAKGRITAARALNGSDIAAALGFTPLSNAGGTISGNLVVTGDLLVQGTLTQVNTNVIEVDDPIITVAKSNATAILPYAGIKIERGGSDAFFVFEEASDRFQFAFSDDNLSSNKTLAAVEASLFVGDLQGNAATATKLATARAINGVAFDGTTAISFDTDAVAEGSTNQYFTVDRARASLVQGAGIAYNPNTGEISVATAGSPVLSVAGRTGNVTLDISDIGGLDTALANRALLAGAIFTGDVKVRASSAGFVALSSGTADAPGKIEFYTADETRRGFIGNKAGTNKLQIAAENGWSWDVAGQVEFALNPTVAGSALWHAGNFTPSSKADLAGAIFTGAIEATTLRSARSSGDDGGRVRLAKPQTNSTLQDGVEIDVWRNRIRFHEDNGMNSYRGAYLDISECLGNVGSKLWHDTNLPASDHGKLILNIADAKAMRALNSAERIKSSPTVATNNMTFPATESGLFYSMALNSGVQVANLPATAGLPDGHAVVVLISGSPSAANSAYVQAETGKTIVYRGFANQKFILVGKGEVFRFTWLSGLDYWLAECLVQPGRVVVSRYYAGGSAWNGSPTSFTHLFYDTSAQDTKNFDLSSNSNTTITAVGVYSAQFRTQFSAAAGGGQSGAVYMIAGDHSGQAASSIAYKLASTVVNEDTLIPEIGWSSVYFPGDKVNGMFAASTVYIYYWYGSNAGRIEMLSR